jgi:pteridine reductase
MKPTHYTERPLSGRSILVTGSAHRVGSVLARALADAGADLVLHAHRSLARAETLARELPVRAMAVSADLGSPAAPVEILDAAKQQGFEVDTLVHSAAGFLHKRALETTASDWDQVFALNLRAFFLLSTEIARRRGSRGGNLVAIADAAAVELWPAYFAHSVAKAGLVALVRALAKAFAPDFRVNAVMPGPVLPPEETPESEREAMAARTLLQRLGRPEHVAQAVLFLLTCDYATGSIVEVTGGSTLWRGSVASPLRTPPPPPETE